MIARLGYSSAANAISIINRGGIINCAITSSDIIRAEKIYGAPIAALKGITVNHKPELAHIEAVIGLQESETQVMNVDVMHVNGMSFLLNIITPLRMIFAAKLKSHSMTCMYQALCGQMSQIKARGFRLCSMKCDPEGGLMAMSNVLNEQHGVIVDPVGRSEPLELRRGAYALSRNVEEVS